MNQKEAAAALGITARGLRDWTKEPGFPDYSEGYDVNAIEAWRDARNRKGSDTSDASQKIALAIKAQKLRQEKASADKKEREEEIARGNILARDELEIALREIVQLTRDEMLGLPQELSKFIPKKYQAKLQREGRKHVEKKLTNFSKRVKGVEDGAGK